MARTNAFDSDTDDDGLSDGWEVNGHNWVDYAFRGVDPLKQDALVEVDYQKYTVGGVTHSAALSDAVID